MNKRKDIILYWLTILFSALFILAGWLIFKEEANMFRNEEPMDTLLCRVTSIVSDEQDISSLGDMYYLERTITFEGKVLSGPQKGQTVTGVQVIDNVSTFGVPPVEEGDKLYLHSLGEEAAASVGAAPDTQWNAGEYYRSDKILYLGAFFLLSLLVFGRKKGVSTVISLGFTFLSIFMVFIPAILAGCSPYVVSSIICVYIIVMTLCLVSGFSIKSFSSALGCAGGVIVAGALTVIMSQIMKLTGFLDDNSMYVHLLNPDVPINLNGIIFAANIIGALGATMDVAMSISSSLHELTEKAPHITPMQLVRSGINIGRDIMGTMANTLVLAYIGSSLSTVLLFITYQSSLSQLLNRELIVVELLQALAGSIGILFTIPISAVVSSLLYSRVKKKHAPSRQEDVLVLQNNPSGAQPR